MSFTALLTKALGGDLSTRAARLKCPGSKSRDHAL